MDGCLECREDWSYGQPKNPKCHIDENGEHCHGGPCVHEDSQDLQGL